MMVSPIITLLRYQERRKVMECSSCGEQLEEGSQFCRFCGEELTGIPAEADLKQKLQSMDEYDFEHFVADLWEEMGWDCEVSTGSNDKGIDVRARKTRPYDQKVLIQAKRYSDGNKVGSPEVQQYYSLKDQEENVDKVLIITTSSFSRNAKQLADSLNVKLIDGDDLVDLVDQEDANGLVTEYIDFEPETPEQESIEEYDRSKLEHSQPQQSKAASGLETDRTPSNITTDRTTVQLPETIWKKGAIICTIGLWVAGIWMDTLPSGVVDPLLFTTWIGLPICLYKDSKATRKVVEWPRWRKSYLALAAVPGLDLFVGPLYLIVRYAIQKGYISVDSNVSHKRPNGARGSTGGQGVTTDTKTIATRFGVDHYTDALDHIRRLKRENQHDEAEELLLWCIDQAESESKLNNYEAPPKWYYKHLAIIYRKDGRYDDEKALLERYIAVCNELGGEPRQELVDRLKSIAS